MTARNTLTILFYTLFIIAATISLLFLFDILPLGYFAALSETTEFYIILTLEILLIVCLPLALKLFKLSAVSRQLQSEGDPALLRWGTLRMLLLGVPMLMGVCAYFLLLVTTPIYIAAIFAISFFFVYPSQSRCEAEMSADQPEKTEK